jgi:small subunit ribosomal protein S8
MGDFLIKIKNAAMAKNKEVKVIPNNKILALAEALKKMGYLDNVKKEKDSLTLSLTFKNKQPLLQNIKLVSKPGLRVYKSILEIEKKKSPSLYLISSPKGIISSKEAIKLRTGGEIIAEIL